MSGAPTLPREVWCWSFGFDPEDGLGALSVMHTQRGAEVEREFDDSRGRPCSPIGRYVLADTARAEWEAGLVAWIRSTYHGPGALDAVASGIADAIERGEHRRDGR